MKTKKCGVYAALAAVLLITAMLVITCTNPLNPGGLAVQKDGEERIFTPPPGKAYITVHIPAETGRTILPTDPGAITTYKVYLIDKAPGAGVDDYTETAAASYNNFQTDNKEAFVVTAGRSYTVTVIGLVSGVPVVGGQAATVTANASGNGSATIAMSGIFNDQSGTNVTGTFNYTIGLDDAFTGAGATITVTPYGSTTPSHTNNTTLTGTPTLASGYYWVNVALTLARHANITYSNILHVHGGQTSTWSPTGLTMNKNTYDVTYDENGATAPGLSITDSNGAGSPGWGHGATVTLNAAYDDVSPATGVKPTKTNHTFDGWFTLASAGTLWKFAGETNANQIYKDTTLYAQFTEIPPAGLAITITPYLHPTEKTITFSPANASISRTNAVNDAYVLSIDATTVIFTGTGTDDGWWYNGDLITGDPVLDKDAIDDWNTANPTKKIDFSIGMKHTFTFTGSIGVSPDPVAPYSGTFTINITD